MDVYLLPFPRYWRLKLENGLFPNQSIVWRPCLGEGRQNLWMKLTPQKLEGWGYTVRWTFYNPNFNRFWPIEPCDGQMTDRQTDERYVARCSCINLQSIRPSNQLAPVSSRPTKQLAPLVNQLASCINIGRVGIQCYEPNFCLFTRLCLQKNHGGPQHN